MNIVITPTALAASNFREIKLYELNRIAHDECFVFIYPSPNPINQENGDGELLEILDVAFDLSSVDTDYGTLPVDPDTRVYVR